MNQDGGVIIATILTAILVIVLIYETIRWVGPDITLDKLIAAAIGCACLLAICISEGIGALPSAFTIVFFVEALIWFGDELGGLTGIKGLVDKTTPGYIIRIAGWIFLIALAASVIYCIATAGPSS